MREKDYCKRFLLKLQRFVGVDKHFRLRYDITLDLGMCWVGFHVLSFGPYPYRRMRYSVSQISACVYLRDLFSRCAVIFSITYWSASSLSSFGASIKSVEGGLVCLVLRVASLLISGGVLDGVVASSW